MIPLHELLNRIHRDPEFGRGEFRIGYLDHLRDKLVYVPLYEVQRDPDSHFCFELTDDEGIRTACTTTASRRCGRMQS